MPSKAEPRRSTRNKRQTSFYEPALISPAVKRVKLDSSSIAVLGNQNPQASCESIAALNAILSGNVAATSIDNATTTSTGTAAATATDIIAAKVQEVQTSSAIIVLKVGTQALKNLTTTSIENFEVPSTVASTGNSVANANKFFRNRAGTFAEVEKPLPFGNPPAWSEYRQALCETLEYFRIYEGSVYHHNDLVYGLLLDFKASEGQYMDEDIIIVKAPGCCEMTDERVRKQTKSQKPDSAGVKIYLNNQAQFVPLVVIVGSNHGLSPSTVPHRYNVAAHFHVTAVWAEMNGEHVIFKFRLQKVNLTEKSWWAPQGSPMPPSSPDYRTKAFRSVCHTCGEESPQIYNEGWICSSYGCPNLGKLKGQPQPAGLTFNTDFLKERTRWPATVMPTYQLVPDAIADDPHNVFDSISLAAWKGFVCPKCKRCNSRIDWNLECCANEDCGYSRKIDHGVLSHRAVLPHHTIEVYGHALGYDEYQGHVQPPTTEFYGHWKILTFKLCKDNYITHFLANKHINAQPGGANDVFMELQKVDGLGLKRSFMKNSKGMSHHPALIMLADSILGPDRMLTRHFARNFGMPYDYVAVADSAPFSQAPPAILNALNRLTWAGDHATQRSPHPPRNELLAVGYMETMKMNYHDDGEHELDDLVCTWSLGGTGEMSFRIKKRYAHPYLSEAFYDPTQEVVMGSDFWEDRIKLHALHNPATMDQYKAEKARIFEMMRTNKKRNSQPPWCLRLHLRHGDFVVMHGANIHTSYEHAVVPGGNLRYGLTARHVHPHLVDAAEHYRGDFTIDPATVYDGDINLPLAL